MLQFGNIESLPDTGRDVLATSAKNQYVFGLVVSLSAPVQSKKSTTNNLSPKFPTAPLRDVLATSAMTQDVFGRVVSASVSHTRGGSDRCSKKNNNNNNKEREKFSPKSLTAPLRDLLATDATTQWFWHHDKRVGPGAVKKKKSTTNNLSAKSIYCPFKFWSGS